MTKEQKQWIDDAPYEELLRRWRFAPAGDSIFKGDTGDYYSKIISERRNANQQLHVSASKSIGWDKRR